METRAFALFDTAVGRCGVVWNDAAVVGLLLPATNAAATRAKLRSGFPDAIEATPPRHAARAVARIVQLLDGKKSDLSAIELDFGAVPPFHRRVYEIARTIPPGETLSYGEIATRLGKPGSARAVGQALGRNPFAIIVPCHRVLAANGKIGGFTATGGTSTKERLLSIEGGAKLPRSRAATRPGRRPTSGFDFDTDEAIAHLRRRDSRLAKLIDEVGPFEMQVSTPSSLFFALAESIVYQQLTAKAAGTIFGRVQALLPRGFTPGALLRLPEEKLRGAGLSGSKALAIRDLARRAENGELPTVAEARKLDNGALIARLTEIRGVGRWTVEMLLMFRLGRQDVLPIDDYGIKKGYAIAFKKPALPSKDDLAAHGAKWTPYRTVASWYLWRATDLASAKKPASLAR